MKRGKFWIMLVLTLAYAGWLGYLMRQHQIAASQRTSRIVFQKVLTELSPESLAKLPDGFPRLYIYGINPVVATASVERFPSGMARYNATIRTSDQPEDLIAQYRDMFTKIGWDILQDTPTNIVAQQGEERLVVITSLDASGTTAQLIYTGPPWPLPSPSATP